MNLTIHRGAKEIGGTCIELQTAESRIILDFGLPLVDENKEPFDPKKVNGKNEKELVRQFILSDIKGLYKNDSPSTDALLLSHPHQDHYGLLSFINPEIPIYMSQGCRLLVAASHFFGQTDCQLENVKTIQSWKSFKKGDFTITPYLVDHSGFDALAFLIEAEGKRVIYSGDFRGHGRKSVLFENILKNPPKDIDYLVLEGSMMGRDKGKYETEQGIENELSARFSKQDDLFFVACSTQNIDRLVSIYRACLKSGRVFVVDPYTAFILDKLRSVSSNIPQYDWGEHIRVFFVPSSYTERMAENKSLFRFKSAKITYDEMQGKRDKLVVKDSYATRKIFSNKRHLDKSVLIYSMWEGYLPEVKPFWDNHNVPIVMVHVSGHAYVEELQKFVGAIKPRWIIPNHTFHPEKYSDHFGSNIRLTKDGETIAL